MSLLAESSNNGLTEALSQGLADISYQQSLTFKQYSKQILTQDGYVFWVANGAILSVTGSLHYGTEQIQEEDQTLGVNAVIFTATQEITSFNVISTGTLWIADWTTPDGGTIQIAFSKKSSFYQQSGLYHYSGFAVYPALASQLVNSAADLPVEPIVSNSLPIWLALNQYAPTYPSFLVSENIEPPYITVHIEPGETIALQGFPQFIWPGTPTPNTALQPMASTQLMRDKVRLTLYGLNNQQAIQYYAYLMEDSINTDNFGFMNSPAIQDEKRTQSEISALAMKKTIEIDASYYQGTADAIARRLILSAALSTISMS